MVLFSYVLIFFTRVTALEGNSAQGTEKTSALLLSDLTGVEESLTKILSTNSPELRTVLFRDLSVFAGRACQEALQLGGNLSAELYFFELSSVADGSFFKCLYGGNLSETDISMLSSLLETTRTIVAHYDANCFSAFAYTSLFSTDADALYLSGLESIDNDTAKNNASVVLKIMPEHIRVASESVGVLAAYECLGSPDGQPTSVFLTKRGGYLYTMRRGSLPAASNISADEAKNLAANRLLEYGYKNMVPKFWKTSEHMIEITLLPFEEGIWFYNDKITVSVSLEDGSILAVDAGDYLMHHGPRSFPSPAFSADEALSKASLVGTPLLEKPCLSAVFGPEGGEVLAYELLYRGESGRPVQVYVDAITARVFDMVCLDLNDGNRHLLS